MVNVCKNKIQLGEKKIRKVETWLLWTHLSAKMYQRRRRNGATALGLAGSRNADMVVDQVI